jgi:imidazolonepropionase-like amidohydrolase
MCAFRLRWLSGPPGSRIQITSIVALVVSLVSWNIGIAEDLVIRNARIIDGTGRTIERGSIVVAKGRISSVSEAAVDTQSAMEIDAQGMTVMPGLVDTHRHDLLVDVQEFSSLASDADVAAAIDRETPRRLQTLLAEGFTTVMMPGMYLSAALDVRQRLKDGRIRGPRLLFTGPSFTAPGGFPVGPVCKGKPFCADNATVQVTDAAVARAEVRALAKAGVDAIKVMFDPAVPLKEAVLAAITDEAQSLRLPPMLHAHRVEDMLAGVRLGARRLVHTPGDISIADGPGARILRERV